MAITPKVIYLEPDEEITSVIDKIRKTEFSDIVLAIPKGASVSQSVVNIKLIKKKAESLNKAISIVTNDRVLRNLAGKVGILTAATIDGLDAAAQEYLEEAVGKSVNEDDPLLNTKEVIFKKEKVSSFGNNDRQNHQDLEDLKVSESEDTKEHALEKKHFLEDIEKTKNSKEKNLVPKFPWKKVLLFGLIPLIILVVIGCIYLPRVKATIYMKSEGKPVSIDITGEKSATLDTDKALLPTTLVEVSKDANKTVTATGTKDAGTKATGSVLISSIDPINWVSGTRVYLQSDSSKIYYLNEAVSLSGSDSKAVSITAASTGDKYNIGKGSTLLAVKDPESSTDIKTSTAIAGGTTKNVTIVSQSDVDSAKEALVENATADLKKDFAKQTTDMKIADDSQTITATDVSADPAVGSETNNFTLTVKVVIKGIAIKNSDISTLIKSEVTRQLGGTREIIDDGSANVSLESVTSDIETGKLSGTITTTAYVSNKLDQEKVKTELTGLNNTQATNYIKGLDGVDDVKFEYFPSFVKAFPRIKGNITLTITVSDSSRS